MFRNNVYFIQNPHERYIAVPAGHDMEMQVFAYAGAGGFPKVEPDIQAVRGKALLHYVRDLLQKRHAFVRFFRCQIADVHDVAIRGDHQMPVIIRVFVHDHKGRFAPVKDEPLLVFIRAFGQAEHAGVRLGPENIVNAPGRPKLFHSLCLY